MHPSLRKEETWRKLSAETCLLNFYFQQGTRQQLWGAAALKAQGWRFHTQVGRLGQRNGLPCLGGRRGRCRPPPLPQPRAPGCLPAVQRMVCAPEHSSRRDRDARNWAAHLLRLQPVSSLPPGTPAGPASAAFPACLTSLRPPHVPLPLPAATTCRKGRACCPRLRSSAAGAPASPAQTSCLVGRRAS